MAMGNPSSPSSSSSSRKKARRAAEHCGRWADLPTDILGLILGRLSSMADRIRFSAVCKPWRSTQPPSSWAWMALSPDPKGKTCSFFRLSDNALITVVFPEADGARFCGSFDSWLVVAHQTHGNFLLNPLSGAKIPLPHQTTIPLCPLRVRPRANPGFISKAVLSSSPADQSPGAVVVAALVGSTLCVCRTHGRTWTCLPDSPTPLRFRDVIFIQGLLHAVDADEKLYTIEVGDEQITCTEGSEIRRADEEEVDDSFTITYLVESRGRLLMVRRLWTYNDHPDFFRCTTGFKVFEAQPGPPRRWAEVKSLGGHALFLGTSCSRSVPATQLQGVKEDCIYFTDTNHLRYKDAIAQEGSDPFLDSGVFSMVDGSITPFLLPTTAASGFESCRSFMTAPLWLQFTYA